MLAGHDRRATSHLPLLATALPVGCAQSGGSLGYWQSLRGRLALLQAAEPVQQWLVSSPTPGAAAPPRLALAQRRAFAVTDLALPDNASYHRFARLERRAAVERGGSRAVLAAAAPLVFPRHWLHRLPRLLRRGRRGTEAASWLPPAWR